MKDVTLQLESWHGSPVDETIKSWGPPTEQKHNSDGTTTVRYDVEGTNIKKAPIDDGDRAKKFCLVLLTTDAKGKIATQKWDGHKRTCANFIEPLIRDIDKGFAEDHCRKADTLFVEVPRLICQVDGQTCEYERDRRLNPTTDCHRG